MFVPFAIALACNSGAGDTSSADAAWAPERYCPGGADGDCADASGALAAGVAAVSITPPCFEAWEDVDYNGEYDSDVEPYFDCGCDRLCPDDEGYPGPDEGEGDGEFQAVWVAGFNTGRPASGVHDDLWARALVLERGETRVALVALDLIGWFYSDVVKTRELAAEAGLDVDQLIVTATHQHEGPDTMGIWGRSITSSGYQEDYAAFVRAQTVEAVRQAIEGLTGVGEVRVGSVDSSTYDAEKGSRNLVRDSRDPLVLDNRVNAARIADSAGQTIATLVNWGNHPETMGSDNTQITSDFAHPLREAMEGGLSWGGEAREGYGGVSIFLNGTVGGLMTPLGVDITDPQGATWSEYTWERNEVLGKLIAGMAMDAIEGGTSDSDPALAVSAQTFMLPVDNWGFQGMFLAGVLSRELFDWDESEIIDEDNVPKVLTEIDHLRLGPLEMITVPGELFPEIAIGGYDGSKAGTSVDAFIEPDNPNPPDVDSAPEGPYWLDRFLTEHAWVLGLGNDELGYIIPAYDFILSDSIPYIEEAEGDHYEETNSLGPDTAPLLDDQVTRLIDWATAR